MTQLIRAICENRNVNCPSKRQFAKNIHLVNLEREQYVCVRHLISPYYRYSCTYISPLHVVPPHTILQHSATQGMNVYVHGKMATVRYIGSTEFADGTWLGVEFRTPDGRHDGTVKGKTYFTWSVLVCVHAYSSGQ